MIYNVSQTSIDSFYSHGSKTLQADRILSVVQSSHADMSLREIKHIYDARFDTEIDVSTVSARCNQLVAEDRLQRATPVRKCQYSGKSVHPVSVAPAQGRLI